MQIWGEILIIKRGKKYFYGGLPAAAWKLIDLMIAEKEKKEKSMRQKLQVVTNKLDDNGNPTGGSVVATGIDISWQDGPLGCDQQCKEPNGASIEGVIAAAISRLEFFQTANDGKFFSSNNQLALTHLVLALEALDARTAERERRNVEGTHTA